MGSVNLQQHGLWSTTSIPTYNLLYAQRVRGSRFCPFLTIPTCPRLTKGEVTMTVSRKMLEAQARNLGICISCTTNAVAAHNCVRCRKCINARSSARKMRKPKLSKVLSEPRNYGGTNPLRKKIMDYAAKHGICTKCCGRLSSFGHRQCEMCLERKRVRAVRVKQAHPKKRGRPRVLYTDAQRRDKKREYQKKWRAKKLYNKVRSLDVIKYAVRDGKQLPTKGE